MIMQAEAQAPSKEAALALLEDTAKSVKVMKASWLRVAINLQEIRRHEIWRMHSSGCASFDDYVYGILDVPRAVAKRMLAAADYTAERKPEFIKDFESGREDIHVPSYDSLNHLRRAENAFEGREDEFSQIESKVFDGEMGRVTLKKTLDDKMGATSTEPADKSATHAEPERPDAPLDLGAVLDELKSIEKKMLKLEVSKEARQLMFQLVEKLQKEKSGRSAKA